LHSSEKRKVLPPRKGRSCLTSENLLLSRKNPKHAPATPPGELAPLLDALTADALDQMRAKDTDEEEGEGRSSSSSGGGGGSSWHRRLGGASLAQVVAAASVASEAGGARRRRWTSASGEGGGGSEALASLVTVACSQLRDAEPRVRHAAAGLLGTLAAASSSNRGGDDAGDETVSVSASASSSSSESFPPVWLLGARDAIFDIVERDWDRDEEEEEEEGGGKKKEKEEAGGGGPVATADGGGGRDGKKSSLIGAALSAAYARPRPGRGELRHGSEGWHCLETALVALLSVADGCGTAFAPVARGRRAEVEASCCGRCCTRTDSCGRQVTGCSGGCVRWPGASGSWTGGEQRKRERKKRKKRR